MRMLRSLTVFLLLIAIVPGCGRKVDPRAQEAYDLVVADEIDEAIAFTNAVLADEPDNAEMRNVLGLALYKSGDAEGSIEQYLEALEDDPKLAEAWFNLGNSYNILKRKDDAENAFTKAIENEKRFVLARYNLGLIYRDSGRFDQALAQFRQAVDYDDQFFPAILELGLMAAAANDSETAIGHFSRVLELNPTFKEVRVHLGNAYMRSSREGALGLAENEFRAAVGVDPEYIDGLYSLGVVLASQQKQEEAIVQFEKVFELTADRPEHPVHERVRQYFDQIGYTPGGATEETSG